MPFREGGVCLFVSPLTNEERFFPWRGEACRAVAWRGVFVFCCGWLVGRSGVPVVVLSKAPRPPPAVVCTYSKVVCGVLLLVRRKYEARFQS